MAKPLQVPGAKVLVMHLPGDDVAREVADGLAEKMVQPGGTIVVTDEDGKELYVAKVMRNGPH